ncbi:MAG: ABC transporter permease [Verrucomicrobiales bacterium]|nr:ABC transporter permease [Verrucomicrobiales bacterium]
MTPRPGTHLSATVAGTTPAWRHWIGEFLGLLIGLAALITVFGLTTDHFLSGTHLRTIANQIPSAVLVATGMTCVLILGQIDLSVGSVLGFAGAMLGVAMTRWHLPLPLAVALALAVGAICGAFNGLVSMRWRLPTFIVTLGMLEMARGAAHAVTGSQTQYIGSAVGRLADASILGFSLPFLVALVVVVATHILMVKTVFGRYTVAIGTNEEAARLSGIDPRGVKLSVFIGTGVLSALAAVIDTSRFQAANPNAGLGLELNAIAAAVIGGTSLMGGRGSVLRTFLGVVIIAVLNSGLAAIGAKDEIKRLITGAVIIAAVIVDVYRQRGVRRPA